MCKLIALPVAISQIIARLSERDYTGAFHAVLLYAAFSFTLGVLVPLIKYIGMRGENPVYFQQTAMYFRKLVNVDMEYFNSNMSGSLTTSTRYYIDGCVILCRSLRDRYSNTILSIIFPLIVIIWSDWLLGLVALGLSAVQAFFLLWASHVVAPLRTKSRNQYKENSGRMADIISNILAVRSSAQENAYADRVKQAAREESETFSVRYALQARLTACREAITVSFFLVLLWMTVQRMADGHISLAIAVLITTYTTVILTGVYSLSEDLDDHDDLIDKIIPAFEILERKNDISDPAEPVHLSHVKGDIELRNVSFAYDGGAKVFNNFSLHIPAGQKLGVVGLSGAGKSTLTKLLLRFNDVEAGAVLLDGMDVRKLAQGELRSQIAYVPQEPLLFHASIKDNVLVSRPEASDKEVEKALKSAHAMHFVENLSDGLDSIVGERGVKLSGGQKQRVAIARAVIRHTPIMVLDEATSALDSESEQIIKDSFSEILKGKTAIVIAHRLSTLSEMDRIVVIENGACIEDGSHEELLAENGAYAKLWKRQQRHLED